MDCQVENTRLETVRKIRKRFEMETPDFTAKIFVIGIQELQRFDMTFKMDQKVEIIHAGICTVLMRCLFQSSLVVQHPRFKRKHPEKNSTQTRIRRRPRDENPSDAVREQG